MAKIYTNFYYENCKACKGWYRPSLNQRLFVYLAYTLPLYQLNQQYLFLYKYRNFKFVCVWKKNKRQLTIIRLIYYIYNWINFLFIEFVCFYLVVRWHLHDQHHHIKCQQKNCASSQKKNRLYNTQTLFIQTYVIQKKI